MSGGMFPVSLPSQRLERNHLANVGGAGPSDPRPRQPTLATAEESRTGTTGVRFVNTAIIEPKKPERERRRNNTSVPRARDNSSRAQL